MLCQNCQKNAANVHFIQIVNNKKVEMYLCEKCAKEKGQINIGSPFGIADFFAGLMGFEEGKPVQDNLQPEVRCKTCGLSYEDFQKTGKLGCSDCYKLFEDRMKPVMKRLHGNMGHTGKVPGRISGNSDISPKSANVSKEIEDLKEQLNKAIKNEEYEKAAELRDKIKEIESGKGG